MEAVLNRVGLDHPLGMEDFEGDLALGMANHREALQDRFQPVGSSEDVFLGSYSVQSLRRPSAGRRRASLSQTHAMPLELLVSFSNSLWDRIRSSF